MGFINQRSHHWGAPSCREFLHFPGEFPIESMSNSQRSKRSNLAPFVGSNDSTAGRQRWCRSGGTQQKKTRGDGFLDINVRLTPYITNICLYYFYIYMVISPYFCVIYIYHICLSRMFWVNHHYP